MTDKEKIEAYDKAVEQAKKELDACSSTLCDAAKQIYRLFPQLKEPENKRIRKWLDSQLQMIYTDANCKGDYERFLMAQKALDFLKKQDTLLECGEGIYYLSKDGSITCIGGPATEGQPTDTGHTNVESDYDKGYREGHRFGLRQTEDYMIGKTFKGLIPCWINAPSTLSPLHQYHGKNAVVMHENNGGFRCMCIDEKKPISFHIPSSEVLVEGWKEKPDAWNGEDEKILHAIELYVSQLDKGETVNGFSSSDMLRVLKSLSPQKNPIVAVDAEQLSKILPKRQEWSEEDERVLYNVIAYVGYAAGQRGVTDDAFKEANEWLINFRFRSSWKPSEEQMKWLKDVIETVPMTCRQQGPLESLYADLQKLL